MIGGLELFSFAFATVEFVEHFGIRGGLKGNFGRTAITPSAISDRRNAGFSDNNGGTLCDALGSFDRDLRASVDPGGTLWGSFLNFCGRDFNLSVIAEDSPGSIGVGSVSFELLITGRSEELSIAFG